MLTEKEIQVMKLRNENKTQKEVAEILQIKQSTVSIFEKKARKKIKDSYETIKFAKEYGLGIQK